MQTLHFRPSTNYPPSTAACLCYFRTRLKYLSLKNTTDGAIAEDRFFVYFASGWRWILSGCLWTFLLKVPLLFELGIEDLILGLLTWALMKKDCFSTGLQITTTFKGTGAKWDWPSQDWPSTLCPIKRRSLTFPARTAPKN